MDDWPDSVFFGAAMTTYGGLGSGMQRLLQRFSQRADEHGPRSFVPRTFAAPTFNVYYRQRLARAVAAGNARLLRPYLTGVEGSRSWRSGRRGSVN